jgi:hypothetical protein
VDEIHLPEVLHLLAVAISLTRGSKADDDNTNANEDDEEADECVELEEKLRLATARAIVVLVARYMHSLHGCEGGDVVIARLLIAESVKRRLFAWATYEESTNRTCVVHLLVLSVRCGVWCVGFSLTYSRCAHLIHPFP